MNADGTGLQSLLDDGNINTLPRWSADSTENYFHRFVFGGSTQFVIARIGADGTGMELLAPGGSHDDVDVDWIRPAGTTRTPGLRVREAWSVGQSGSMQRHAVLVPGS